MKLTKITWISLIMIPVVLIMIFWAYNHKIINSKYDQLTISTMDQKTYVITNQKEIDKFINQINNSPRKFVPNWSWGQEYDYLPHAILTFENDEGKFQLGYVIPIGIVLTNNWEIKTQFNFEKQID
jgi:sensor domain CHASE-containing protein